MLKKSTSFIRPGLARRGNALKVHKRSSFAPITTTTTTTTSSSSSFSSCSHVSSLSLSTQGPGAPLSNPYGHSVAAFEDSLAFYDKLVSYKGNNTVLSEKINKSLECLISGLRLYGTKYMFSSFNGGKDAVVVLHLLRAAAAKYSLDSGRIEQVKFIYFGVSADDFSEIIEFIVETEKQFDIDLVRYECSIEKGIGQHISSLELGSHSAFVVGTRMTDPNWKGQECFCPSSSWMPPFMRINPILEWDYGDVWHFLKHFELPYCVLYDEGYTSLGNLSETVRNPLLKRTDNPSSDPDSVTYWPAYMLAEYDQERAGRGKQQS
jgi:FAD synthetase